MLVHFHIPKTAGTSTKRVIESWYQLCRVEQLPDVEQLRGRSDRDICVSSHFSSAIFGEDGALTDALPEMVGNPDYKVFTLLRDPLDQLVSSYYHFRSKSDKNIPSDIVSFAEFPSRFLYRNSMSAYDEKARDDVIGSFYFIGDTSDIDGSMKYLAELLGKPPVNVPKENVGDRDELILQLTSRQRSRIERALAPEYELFETVRDMLRERSFTGSAETRADQFEFTRKLERRIRAPQLPGLDGAEEADLQSDIREREENYNQIISSKSARIEELEVREASLSDQLSDERDRRNAAETEARAIKRLLEKEQQLRAEQYALLEETMLEVKVWQRRLNERGSVRAIIAAKIKRVLREFWAWSKAGHVVAHIRNIANGVAKRFR
ncbi:sulfotransferase family 2 domain-containing protein [Thalassovita mediterranea]|nr:sulfotransferase family 2 domain-containing protein [Thalassovita mediterranea]